MHSTTPPARALSRMARGIAAMSSWFALRPFLSALAWDVHVPLVGHLHLSSVLLFDLGVYMLVVGATVLVLVALAHQSMRAQRRAAAEAEAEEEAAAQPPAAGGAAPQPEGA
mgnify:CR=1 FL=1